jgi:hypothetical protein
MFDGGQWEYIENQDGDVPHVEKYFIEGPNSEHDVRLYINGNMTSDMAREYGERLCEFLNTPKEQ